MTERSTSPTGSAPAPPEPRMIALARARWPRRTELALFCLVGLSGVVVDYAVFVPLIHFASLDPRLAAVISFLVAVSWNYLLNRRYTFTGARDVAAARSYTTFVAVCAVGIAVRVATMHGIMVTVGWAEPPAVYLTNFLGIVAATAVNFLGSKFLAFRR